MALAIDELPHEEAYEALAGFLMVMLRRVSRRTDSVTWAGYKFKVMDVPAASLTRCVRKQTDWIAW